MNSFVALFIVITFSLIELSLAIHHGASKTESIHKHVHVKKYAIDPADQLDTRDIELAKVAFDLQDDAENERVKGDLQLGEEINKITSQNTYFGPRFSESDEEPLIRDGVLRSSILKPRKHTKRRIVKKHLIHDKHRKKSAKHSKKQKILKNNKHQDKKVQKKSIVKKILSKKGKKRTKHTKKHAKQLAKKRGKTHHKHDDTTSQKKLSTLKKFYAKDYGDEGDDFIENYKPESKDEDTERYNKGEFNEADNIIDKMRENAGYGDNEEDEDRFDENKSLYNRDNNRDNDEENDNKEDEHEEDEGDRDSHEEHEEHEENEDNEDEDKDEDNDDNKGYHGYNDDNEEDQGIIKQNNDKMEVADNGLVFNQETGTINENLLKKDPEFHERPAADRFVDEEMRESGIEKKSKSGGALQVKQKVKLGEKTKTKAVVINPSKLPKKEVTKEKVKPKTVKASKKSDLLEYKDDVDNDDNDDNDEEFNEDLW